MSDNGQATTDAASEQAAPAADTTLLTSDPVTQPAAQAPAGTEGGEQQPAESKPAEAKEGEEGKGDGEKTPIEYDLST